MEGEKQYTPEEMAELEKSRAINDAELLKDGAEYKVDEKGNKHLEVTEQHIGTAIEFHNDIELAEKYCTKEFLGKMKHILIRSVHENPELDPEYKSKYCTMLDDVFTHTKIEILVESALLYKEKLRSEGN